MRHLADTHVVVWWHAAHPSLPARYKQLLEAAERLGPRVGVSAITLWEIAKLYELGRIVLTTSLDECLADIESGPAFEIVPLTAPIAAESTRLGPTFPRDPADQLIGATARCHGLALMTVDQPIRDSKVVAIV